MHQGQICKLRQRGAGDAGWYQKLRADNGCVGFYPIRSSPLSEPAFRTRRSIPPGLIVFRPAHTSYPSFCPLQNR